VIKSEEIQSHTHNAAEAMDTNVKKVDEGVSAVDSAAKAFNAITSGI